MPRRSASSSTIRRRSFRARDWSRRKMRWRRLPAATCRRWSIRSLVRRCWSRRPHGHYAGRHGCDARDRPRVLRPRGRHEEDAAESVRRHGADRRRGEGGLSWLVRQQRSRGYVELAAVRTRRRHDVENEEAATAMALLAFQGAGYTTIEQQERSVHARCNARVEGAAAQSAGGRALLRQPHRRSSISSTRRRCARSRCASCME